MENRTLRIDSDSPRFRYQYQQCNGKLWPLRRCWIEVEYYDFTDQETRQRLKDMGFKLKVLK